MKKLCFIIFPFLCTFLLHSQTEYGKVFLGNEYPITKIAVQNGNAAVISNSEVTYLDSVGNVKWSKYLQHIILFKFKQKVTFKSNLYNSLILLVNCKILYSM